MALSISAGKIVRSSITGAGNSKRIMRQAFIDTLYALAAKDKKIILMNGDLGFSVLEGFMSAYPDRSYNMGVAEANMIGAAAGYARGRKSDVWGKRVDLGG